MTAEQRTDKLLLEVLALRSVEPNRRQFNSLELQQYLESHHLELAIEEIERMLHGLARTGAVSWSVTDDIRYRITLFGSDLLRDLRSAALAEEEVD